MKLLKIGSIILISAFLIVACNQTTKNPAGENTGNTGNTTSEPKTTPDELASGRKIYKE